MGGSIRGEMLGPYLYGTPHTCGPYGKRILEGFSLPDQHILREVTKEIFEHAGSST